MTTWKINPAWEDAPYDLPWLFKPQSINIMPKPKGTICIDFDGVIHSYVQPWINATTIPDPPVYGAFDFIIRCQEQGFQVAIFSSRSHQEGGIPAMIAWFKEHGFYNTDSLDFPREKPPALIYIDDRGFCFRGEWPSAHFLETFRPWNRADDAK